MYFYGNNNGTVEDFPELQSNWRSKIHTRAQVVGGNWIWTPGTRWVNEARVGYNRLYQPTFPGDIDTPRPATASTPASAVRSPADFPASVSLEHSSPAWAPSSGRSSRGRTPELSSSTTFPIPRANTL